MRPLLVQIHIQFITGKQMSALLLMERGSEDVTVVVTLTFNSFFSEVENLAWKMRSAGEVNV